MMVLFEILAAATRVPVKLQMKVIAMYQRVAVAVMAFEQAVGDAPPLEEDVQRASVSSCLHIL